MRKARLFSANVGLAALVVLDVPLIVAAVQHGHGRADAAPVATVAVADASASASTPTESGSVVPRVGHRSKSLLLSFSGASDGWRAHPGCKVSPHLAATTDGGRSWEPLSAPVPHVLRINRTGPAAGWLVGADASCAPAFFSTADGGKTWAAGTGLAQAWVVIGRQLRLPSGTISRPCGKGAALELVTPASVPVALVQCESGLLTTTDGGESWRPVAAFPYGGRAVAAALMAASSGRGVALLSGATNCAGVAVVRTQDAGEHWHGGTCLASLQPPIALTLAADGSGYATGAGGVARTQDAGKTWAVSTSNG